MEDLKIFGGIDHVVNNAGIGYPGFLEEGGYVTVPFLLRG